MTYNLSYIFLDAEASGSMYNRGDSNNNTSAAATANLDRAKEALRRVLLSKPDGIYLSLLQQYYKASLLTTSSLRHVIVKHATSLLSRELLDYEASA